MLAALEQYNRLAARFTLRRAAWLWWGGRLLLEAGAGAASVSAVQHFNLIGSGGAPFGSDHLFGWLVAGAAAPAVLRLRFLDLGRGETARPLGPARLYDLLRRVFERELDDIGADEQARWINESILPSLERQGTSAEELGRNLEDYFRGLKRMSLTDTADAIRFVRETLGSRQDDATKRELLVRRAIELRGYRVVQRLTRGDA